MSSIRVVVVTGNPALPSRTRVLAQAIVDAIGKRVSIDTYFVELATIGPALGSSHFRKRLPVVAEEAIASVESADLLVVASPVYRASYTGLFKHLFDLVGLDALAGTPVVLAATGGSERHALIIEHQLRPLFSFFRALTVPTGVYATEGDFEGYELVSQPVRERIEAAATEAVTLSRPSGALVERLRAIA
ncbi:MAG: FMN reductase [Burkholderiales bacterium]|nr:FMN reductase [Burkholderiales bacterium]